MRRFSNTLPVERVCQQKRQKSGSGCRYPILLRLLGLEDFPQKLPKSALRHERGATHIAYWRTACCYNLARKHSCVSSIQISQTFGQGRCQEAGLYFGWPLIYIISSRLKHTRLPEFPIKGFMSRDSVPNQSKLHYISLFDSLSCRGRDFSLDLFLTRQCFHAAVLPEIEHLCTKMNKVLAPEVSSPQSASAVATHYAVQY